MSFSLIRRSVARVVSVLGLVIGLAQLASAQRAMPEPAPLTNFNPLCDSTLVHCLEIDDFAGHLYGHLQVLPRTDRRDTAAVFPVGITLGLFGRVVGGISTNYSFWREDDVLYQQLGPLRLSLVGRILPLFSDALRNDAAEGADSSPAAYSPSGRFQLGLAYEQEVRVGPFSGANSLGLMNDLASLSIVGSKVLGPFQLSASVGALYDWRGSFMSPMLAAQLGLFLPGFKQLKVFIEGMGRGFWSYVKADALPPVPDGQAPIRQQGVLGGGFAFHPHQRVDLSVSVQRGFGGIAPWVVSVNFLVLSVGKTYQGRAATPLAETGAVLAAAFANWAIEKLKTIDPYLRKDCILYDDDHKPIRKLGELSPDGKSCIYQGLAIPIGPHFWHNEADTVLCYDKRLKECFLTRSDRSAQWEPVHPLLVHDDCFAYYNGQPWMRIGKPSADKQSCDSQGHVIPVGQTLKPDHDHTRYYCYDESDKATNQTRKSWCIERPDKPQNDGQYTGRRFAAGIDRANDRINRIGQSAKQIIDEGAAGVPLHATTPIHEATGAGKDVLNRLKNATTEDAKNAFFGVLKGTKDWLAKPLRDQLGDVAEELGDSAASPTTYLPGASLLGKGGTLAVNGVDGLADAAKTSRKAKQLARAATRAEHGTLDAFKAEKKAVHTAQSAQHAASEPKTTGGLLQQHDELGGHTLSKHAGKTDDELVERLKQEPHINGASTFTDEAIADRVVHTALDANRKEIDEWLKSSVKKPLVLKHDGNDVIGRGIMRGEAAVSDRKNALIVLKKNKEGGFHVLTAYVE